MRRLRSAVDAIATGRRSVRLEGFSLHADVAVPARRRDQLEKLCRYVVRPPLALERLTESLGGQLRYQFRRPWRDGSTALLLEPAELLERLAPSSARRGGRCWPTTASSPRAPAGEPRWSRRRRVATRARTRGRDRRDGGPGRGSSAACSRSTSWSVIAVPGRTGSSAR